MGKKPLLSGYLYCCWFRCYADFQTWFDGHDSTCHDATPQAQIQTSASALGSFSFFKSFGRGQTETIRGQVVFLIFYLFFYIFLFWRDWTHILAESQSSVKYAFMQIFLRGHSLCHGCEDVPWTWITLSTLSKIWKIRGRRELNFWYTKVGGPKK